MKTIRNLKKVLVINFLIALVLPIAATSAFGENVMILRRSSFPGKTKFGWRDKLFTQCDITGTQVVITRTLMKFPITESKNIQFENSVALDKFFELIDSAAKGTFLESVVPDTTFFNYFAMQKNSTSVILDATNPMDLKRKINQSFLTKHLKDILDLQCGPVPTL